MAVFRRRVALAVVWMLLNGAFYAGVAAAQQEDPAPPLDGPGAASLLPTASAAPPANLVRVTVQGAVKNAVTGEPLARALVRIEGDAADGALTDGEGRFEISGVPIGPQVFQVIKPGFADQPVTGVMSTSVIVNPAANSEHNVRIAADMPELNFALSPTNAIRGQISLSTGDPAQGIGVMLLRRSVQDGRALWQTATNTRTNSDGMFRFAGLADGVYTIYSEPAMDTDIAANLVETGSDRAITRWGYPSLFYPDARDLSSAAKIQVAGGQQAQANLLLTEEPFHLVRAALVSPSAARLASDMNVTVTVQDAQGHQLPYSGQYDPSSRSVQAFVPDGSYFLQVTALGGDGPMRFASQHPPRDTVEAFPTQRPPQGPLIGQLEVSVTGHAVTGLRVPLAAQGNSSVQFSLLRSGAQQDASNLQGSPLVVMVSQAGGWITDGMVSSYAEGYAPGAIDTTYMGPGSYWVHTSIPQKGLCEGSFTAGGANLAREPLVISPSGSTGPMLLTLRDDCATLVLTLPANIMTPNVGEEPYYIVYVVPEFDSTVEVTPITLRPSSGGMYALAGLTPGTYKVYAFPGPVELEYRNPDALAALPNPGQTVTLEPSGTAQLEVEVPGR